MCIRDRLGTHAGFRHLRRQRHVDILLYIGAQTRFADIDQQGLARPAAAPVCTGPPTGRKIGKQKSQGFKRR
eukprot:11378291-Alexandrium_andersonii.AAC.1